MAANQLQRRIASLLLTILVPVSLTADDAAAMLYSNGGVLVNKNPVRPAWALFSGDLVETQPGSPARIQLDGSTVDIGPESIIEFQRDEVVLEHGSVFVGTLREFRVRSGCLLVTPVSTNRTQYMVSNTDGKVSVSAQQHDVNIDSQGKGSQLSKTSSSNRATVREGEQKSRDEKCGAADLPPSASASNSIMNSPYVVGSAAGAVATITCWSLCTSDNPASPSKP